MSKEPAVLWNTLRHPDTLGYFACSNIEWRFIVEHAPWWGGFYERLVRSVKTALKKVIGRRCLGFIELSTTPTEVEAVINSRPFTHMHDDPNNGSLLTLASFLTGKRVTALPAAGNRALKPDAKFFANAVEKQKANTQDILAGVAQRISQTAALGVHNEAGQREGAESRRRGAPTGESPTTTVEGQCHCLAVSWPRRGNTIL